MLKCILSGKILLYPKFQPVHCMHVNSVVHLVEKHSKSWNFWGDGFFTNFSKIAFSEKVTTDFKNRAKRQTDTRQSISNANFHPFRTLPVWMQTIQNVNNMVFVRKKSFSKMLSKAVIDYSKELWNYRTSRFVYTVTRRHALVSKKDPHCMQ